jgi:TolB-like protein
VPDGQPNSAFEALCRRLLAGDAPLPQVRTRAPRTATTDGPLPEAQTPATLPDIGSGAAAPAPEQELPPFPREQAGKKTRYALEVLGWYVESGLVLFRRLVDSGLVLFRRLPLMWRAAVYIYIGMTVLGIIFDRPSEPMLTAAETRKLQALSDKYQSKGRESLARLAQVGRELAGSSASAGGGGAPLLAIPFGAPAGNPEARRLADATFAQVYGRIAISHHGRASLLEEALPSLDAAKALELARKEHARYVLLGIVDGEGTQARLTVRMLNVEDGSEDWSKSYPTQGADPAAIATEVDQRVHEHEDDA